MTGINLDPEPVKDIGDPGEYYYNSAWEVGQGVTNLPIAEQNDRRQRIKKTLRESADPAQTARIWDSWTETRNFLDNAKQPEPVSIWEPVATELKASLQTYYTGMAAIPMAAASIPHWVAGMDGDSPFIQLTELARSHYDARSDERTEQAQRNADAGGGRVKMIVGSLVGQAPEMLATGFGVTSLVKTMFQMGSKTALTAAQLRRAFLTSTAVQAGMEGTKNTVGRMAENVAAGEEALRAEDVAAGLAIAAVTMLTEIPGGMRGEYRALSQRGWRSKASEAAKDFVIQPGQEALQEGATQIINDLADGKHVNWTEVGWSALAGAIGGGMFAVPGTLGAITGHATDPQAAAEIVRIATAAAKAPQVIKFSDSIASAVSKAASMPEVSKAPEVVLRQLFQNSSAGDIHITLDDFKIIATKRGSSTESLLIEMGAKAGGGDVAIPAENFMANMVKNSPEMMEEVKTMIKQDAGAPSRKDLAELVDAMETLKQRKIGDTLPDGETKDDSQKIVDEMTAEGVTAAAVSKAKLTDTQVRGAAELAAVQFRTAAIQWNTAYEAQGKAERVTPKQLYDKYRAQITGVPGGKSDTTVQQPAYHGTGNSQPYDRFAYDKVGGPGGEGAQAYGWGLYFTSLKEVAAIYRKKFALGRIIKVDGVEPSGESVVQWSAHNTIKAHNGDIAAASKEYDASIDSLKAAAAKYPGGILTEDLDVDGMFMSSGADLNVGIQQMEDGRDYVKSLAGRVTVEQKGKLYTADIPEDTEMLDWDKDLDAQPDSVKAALRKIDQGIIDAIDDSLAERNQGGILDGGYTGKHIYRLLAKHSDVLPDSDPYNENKAASDYLLSIGIPGIRYLGEQHKAGTDIPNYVIFDDSKIQIKALEQGNGAAPRGEYDYVSKIIRLGADANPSTIHHELMHHWLEVTKSWASDQSAPDVFRQNLTDIGAWAAKNAGKVASIYKKASGKEVSTEAIVAAAADMQNLNLNSQAGKAIHEAVAYGYEQYLTEGKAPTKELKRVFKQIANYFNKIIKQLMRSEVLTDPALTKVFDRMLTASDAKAIAHLSPQAIEASGMSAEMATLLNGLYGEQLAAAQQQAYAKVVSQVKKDYEAELAMRTAERKSELMTQSVYRAQVSLAEKPMNAEKAKAYLAGTEHAGLDIAAYVTERGGSDPLDVANENGFSDGPMDMLIQLAASQPVDVVARQDAETAMDSDNRPSAEDLAQEIIDSESGSLMIAAAELRALRAPAKVAGQAATEATEAGKEATQEAIEVSTAELKAKIQQIADKARMDKQSHLEALENFKNWVNSIRTAGLGMDAQKRLASKAVSVKDLADQMESASAKAAKLASKGKLEEAFWAQVEVSTLAEMQRQVIANERSDAKAEKEDRVAIMKRNIKKDVDALAAWAHGEVVKMPMTELRPDVFARRVEAARSAREVAAAKGDKAKMISATEGLVYALAMQREVLDTMAARQRMTSQLIKYTTAAELKYLADAGYPTVTVGNVTTVYSTMEEAQAAAAVAPHGTTVNRTTDLHDIGRAISGVLSSNKDTQRAAAQSLLAIKQSNPGMLTPDVQRMLETGKISVYPMPGRGPDFVKEFTTLDFATLTAQMLFVREEAARRPSVAKEQGKLIADGIGAIQALPKDHQPQTENRFYDFAFRTMKNVTLHLHALGAYGKQIVAKMDDSNVQQQEYQRQIAKVISPAQRALHKDGVDRESRKNVLGVDTSRHEDLVRLLMLGTKTGRQRVAADLQVRAKGINVNQYLQAISKLTETEAAWLEAMWKANEMIWEWDSASARTHGVPLPKTLEATSVPVVIDGKLTELTGGYASVPYADSEGPSFDMLTDSKVKPADVARGLYKDREDVVLGKKMDLSSAAQVRSQMSHIRTAAYLGLATEMRVLLAPDSPFLVLAKEKMGEGWVREFKKYLQFTVTGIKPGSMFETGFRFLNFAQVMAVFGFNFTSAVSQLTGIVGSIGHPNVGFQAVVGASGRFLSEMASKRSVKAPFQRIGEQSAEMLHRVDGQSMDWNSIDELSGKETAIGKFRVLATAPIRRMQQIVDAITYQAAWDRAMAELPADVTGDARLAAAKRIATNAVKETQGTALRSRQSEIAQTQFGVCATFAGKWMMNNANWLSTLYYDAKMQGWKGGKKEFTIAVLTSVFGSTAAMIALRAALQPEDDDDEQRRLQDYAVKWAIDSATQPWYLGRIVANVAQQAFTEQTWNRPTDLVPQFSTFTNGASLIISQMKDSSDSDDIPKIIAGLVGMGAIVPGVPSVQLKRSIDAYTDKDAWEDPWETFMQSIFGADRVARIAN